MPFGCCWGEFFLAVLTLDAIIGYCCAWGYDSSIPRTLDGSSKLSASNSPFRVQFLVFCIVWELLLGCLDKLLVFFIKSSLSNGIESFSLLDKDLFTYLAVLLKCFLVESSPAQVTFESTIINVNRNARVTLSLKLPFLVLESFLGSKSGTLALARIQAKFNSWSSHLLIESWSCTSCCCIIELII